MLWIKDIASNFNDFLFISINSTNRTMYCCNFSDVTSYVVPSEVRVSSNFTFVSTSPKTSFFFTIFDKEAHIIIPSGSIKANQSISYFSSVSIIFKYFLSSSCPFMIKICSLWSSKIVNNQS